MESVSEQSTSSRKIGPEPMSKESTAGTAVPKVLDNKDNSEITTGTIDRQDG